MRVDDDRIIIMTDRKESGPAMLVPVTGGLIASPTSIPALDRRAMLEKEQSGWSWWKQSAELVNDQRFAFQAVTASEADFGLTDTANKPYGHIKFAVDGSAAEY